MQKRTWKRIAFSVLGVLVLGTVVLAVHIYIYMMTRPRVDAGTRVMVRIDLRQDIGPADAGAITDWLYLQKGVDHVLVNPQSDIAIFTFAPVSNSAGRIVSDFIARTAYKQARRYRPSVKEMQGGCPVAHNFF